MSDIVLTDSDIEILPQEAQQHPTLIGLQKAHQHPNPIGPFTSEVYSSTDEDDDTIDSDYEFDTNTEHFHKAPLLAKGVYTFRPINVPDGYFKVFVDEKGQERMVFFKHDKLHRLLQKAKLKTIKKPRLGALMNQRPTIHFLPPHQDPRITR